MKVANNKDYFWSILRIILGLIFLWAFFDKLIGLGFTTCLITETNSIDYLCDSSWIKGGSPTTGFLKFATKGPFTYIFHSLAGSVIVDWIFMIGLLGIGLALTLGFLIKFASISGALMMFLMWLAVLPPEHHPFLDDHIVYMIILLGLAYVNEGKLFKISNLQKK